MATTNTFRPTVGTGRDGFGQLLRAEWTKFRSVPRWVLSLLVTVLLTLGLSLLAVSGSGSDLNDHPEELGPVGPEGVRVKDAISLVHQPLTGDGSITARVLELTGDAGYLHEWAKAGLIIRESIEPGARYTAILVTPEHGVRLQTNYTTDLAASAETTPRWLRLTRAGDAITAYESSDGATWREVGTVELDDLPQTVEVGMFATSPDRVEIETSVGSASVAATGALATGTFDNVRVEPADANWQAHDSSTDLVKGTEASEVDGTFSVTGSGDIGPNPPDEDVTGTRPARHLLRADRGHRGRGPVHHLRVPAGNDPDDLRRQPSARPGAGRQGDGARRRNVRGRPTHHCHGVLAPAPECFVDLPQVSLSGILFGQALVAVLALLAMTNEYGTRMICTSLTTNPRRTEVLLSKAGVVTAAVVAAGTLGVTGSLFASRAILSGNGFPALSLTDGATLRAAIGSVLYLGLIGLLSLGIGVVVRDTAGAVTAVLALLYFAPMAAALISDPQWRDWLHRFGPTTAGQSIQATIGLDDLPIGPWAGLLVLAAYAGAAVLAAAIMFQTRDA
jgi:ABC-type transport system involved in multi-copper enzyme maturation permease subunit